MKATTMEAMEEDSVAADVAATTIQVTSAHCVKCARRKGTRQIDAAT
jgi:hypothetical protein